MVGVITACHTMRSFRWLVYISHAVRIPVLMKQCATKNHPTFLTHKMHEQCKRV